MLCCSIRWDNFCCHRASRSSRYDLNNPSGHMKEFDTCWIVAARELLESSHLVLLMVLALNDSVKLSLSVLLTATASVSISLKQSYQLPLMLRFFRLYQEQLCVAFKRPSLLLWLFSCIVLRIVQQFRFAMLCSH